MSTENPHIIIDLGSDCVKAGFAGEPGPRVVLPNILGRPKAGGFTIGGEPRDYVVGAAADEHREQLSITSPVSHGFVTDWEDLARVLDHTFRELAVDPASHNVMITEPPLNPKHQRERMTQLMFDRFGVDGLYIAISSVLALYSAGAFTGIVVEIGDAVTHLTPIFDGYALPHSILRVDMAGRDITEYLQALLAARGGSPASRVERAAVKRIKEAACRVALDFDEEMGRAREEVQVPLPDGRVVQLGAERFRAPELLFRPSLAGKTFAGLSEQIYQSIMKSDVDVRKDLYQNIMLCGGSSQFPGLRERVLRDVQRLAPRGLVSLVRCTSVPGGADGVWLGGSFLSLISTFGTMWITKDEYDDAGPTIVHRKCF